VGPIDQPIELRRQVQRAPLAEVYRHHADLEVVPLEGIRSGGG
jgi:hypothetical protein